MSVTNFTWEEIMEKHIPTYAEALSIFKEFNQSDGLLKHAFAVKLKYISRWL